MTRTTTILVLLIGVIGSSIGFSGEMSSPKPLVKAHAHNDYWHKRPLCDALDQGFCSIEADVFLVDGQILVGHDEKEIKPERTLEALYLKPLQKRVRENGGRVFRDGPVLWLWIDQKTDAEPTYRVLHKLLEKYADMLTSVEDGTETERAIRVIISGNCPVELIKTQDAREPRLAGIDGRLSDLDPENPGSKLPPHLMPVVSDNWRDVFKWRAIGSMPEAERAQLDEIVRKAHAAGRRIRFWATPENETVWSTLLDADVDLFSTDQLSRLKKFFTP